MHPTVLCLRWSSVWGRAVARGHVGAILAVAFVVVGQLIFYADMNANAPWAAFVTFLVVDCGVTFLSLTAILLRPLDLVVHDENHESSNVDNIAETTTTVAPENNPNDDPEPGYDDNNVNNDETTLQQPLTASLSAPASVTQDRAVPTTHEILRLTHDDTALTVHTIVTAVCTTLSILSDTLATFLQADADVVTVMHVAWFLVLDILNDFFYCVGILVFVVSYRTTALQVWHWQQKLEELYEHSVASHHPTDAPAMLTTLQDCLVTYEQVFDRTERLSAQTTPLALTIVSFVAVEMASTVTDVFEEENFDIDNISHLAMLRLLLVLSAVILQMALAAADVVYASERLAEVLARWEAYWRLQHAQNSHNKNSALSYGSVASTSASSDLAAALAAVCKALGDRARNHPVRLRMSWFHLETEWSLGLAFLVVTVLLAIVGVKLPGGE